MEVSCGRLEAGPGSRIIIYQIVEAGIVVTTSPGRDGWGSPDSLRSGARRTAVRRRAVTGTIGAWPRRHRFARAPGPRRAVAVVAALTLVVIVAGGAACSPLSVPIRWLRVA